MPKQLPRQIKKIESKENKGQTGAWRKSFCPRYVGVLARTRENIYNTVVETLASKGAQISCRKGCTHCCYHYVTVSVAQGIVIADYLYKRRELLTQFVHNYEKWHRKGRSISESIDAARIQALSSSVPVERIIADTRPLSERYLKMHIQCPFLLENRCFIYEVRPLSCSGHYSASPPDWCAPETSQKPDIHHRIPNDQDLTELALLADPRLTLYELTLPIMVYKLLSEGSEAMMTEVAQHNFS